MHEPFLPQPLPSPPELGLGRLVARLARRAAARLLARRGRRRKTREPRLAPTGRCPARGPRLRPPLPLG